jgi:hypothetical protein
LKIEKADYMGSVAGRNAENCTLHRFFDLRLFDLRLVTDFVLLL